MLFLRDIFAFAHKNVSWPQVDHGFSQVKGIFWGYVIRFLDMPRGKKGSSGLIHILVEVGRWNMVEVRKSLRV